MFRGPNSVGARPLLGTSASLLVTSALLVVTMVAIRNKNELSSTLVSSSPILVSSRVQEALHREEVALEKLKVSPIDRTEPKRQGDGDGMVVGCQDAILKEKWLVADSERV